MRLVPIGRRAQSFRIGVLVLEIRQAAHLARIEGPILREKRDAPAVDRRLYT
jgi:hypothetical protein